MLEPTIKETVLGLAEVRQLFKVPKVGTIAGCYVSDGKVARNAEKLVARGKLNAAIDEYRKLLAESANDTTTLNRVGDLYARLNRLDKATALFKKTADHFIDEGFFVKAIAIYKKIIRLDPAQMALAFVNSRPFLTSTIIGATSMDQLKSNIGSIELALSQPVLEGIEAAEEAGLRVKLNCVVVREFNDGEDVVDLARARGDPVEAEPQPFSIFSVLDSVAGVVGHSQGGVVGLLLTAGEDRLPAKSLVLLATPGRTMHEILEEQIRLCPEQYFWVHRKFKNLPDEHPDYYADLAASK